MTGSDEKTMKLIHGNAKSFNLAARINNKHYLQGMGHAALSVLVRQISMTHCTKKIGQEIASVNTFMTLINNAIMLMAILVLSCKQPKVVGLPPL